MYLHATLIPKLGRRAELIETLAAITRAMESPGMTLLAALETLSGAPGQIIDIWRLDDANTIVSALEGAATHPQHQRTLDRLGRSLTTERLRLVVDADFSRELLLSPRGLEARYLHAKLSVHYGQTARLSEVILELRDLFEANFGWRLVAGYRTLIGDFGELYDLWELPAGASVEDTLVAARGLPAFAKIEARLPEYVVSEELSILRPTSYCPAG